MNKLEDANIREIQSPQHKSTISLPVFIIKSKHDKDV